MTITRYTQPCIEVKHRPEFSTSEVDLFVDPKGKWVKYDDVKSLLPDLQPIDTAPKDGTPILGYSDSGFFEGRKTRFVVVHYAGEAQGWTMPGVGGLSISHWMPLPQWVAMRLTSL